MSRQAVLVVLERAANDITFFGQLANDPQVALKDFDLTSEEKVALTIGDVGFIESRTGKKLDEKVMKKVIIPLLSRERW
ncbi:hypothetical protein ES705_09328 [subsurface metagenome]